MLQQSHATASLNSYAHHKPKRMPKLAKILPKAPGGGVLQSTKQMFSDFRAFTKSLGSKVPD